jgi:hypothetical protein
VSCKSSSCKQVLKLVEDLYKFQGRIEPPCTVQDVGCPDAAEGDAQTLSLVMLSGVMSSGDSLPPHVQEMIKHFVEKPTTRSFDCIKNAYI